MKQDIVKKIKGLYKTIQESDIPNLVFIEREETGEHEGQWRVDEQFFPKVKGEHSRYNTFFLQDYNEYKPPEGFKGMIIIDDM